MDGGGAWKRMISGRRAVGKRAKMVRGWGWKRVIDF